MKKFVSLTLVLIICFALALPAFADGYYPVYSEIPVKVINKDGAQAYADNDLEEKKSEIRIPYLTELTAKWPAIQDDILFYSVEYNGDTVYVRASDLTTDSIIKPKEEYRYDPPLRFIVLTEKGEPLRSGPSELCEELSVIPVGTVIEATYADIEMSDHYSVWSYTTYDNVSGWVNTGEEGVIDRFGIPVKNSKGANSPLGNYYAIKDTPLYSGDDVDSYNPGAKLITIPAGTSGTFDYYVTYEHYDETFICIEYNGVKGWTRIGGREVFDYDLMIDCDGYLMVTDTLKLYEDNNLQPGADSGKTVETNRILQYDYSFVRTLSDADSDSDEYWDATHEACYRVTVDSKQYWVCSEWNNPKLSEFYGGMMCKAKTNIKVYSDLDDKSKLIGKIPAGSNYLSLFGFYSRDSETSYDYVAFEDIRGWISDANYDYVNIPDNVLLTPSDENIKTALEKYSNAKPIKRDVSDSDIGEYYSTETDSIAEAAGFQESEIAETVETTASEANPLAPDSPNKIVVACVAGAAAAVVIASLGIARARKKKEE